MITKDKLAAAIGILILVAFAVFIDYMLGLTKTNEMEWTRAVYLFTGVETIAFAAAGYFFGREVHRERAEKAESEADKARNKNDAVNDRATDAEKEATKAKTNGEALKAAIISKVEGQRKKVQLFSATNFNKDQTSQITNEDFAELETMAKILFP